MVCKLGNLLQRPLSKLSWIWQITGHTNGRNTEFEMIYAGLIFFYLTKKKKEQQCVNFLYATYIWNIIVLLLMDHLSPVCGAFKTGGILHPVGPYGCYDWSMHCSLWPQCKWTVTTTKTNSLNFPHWASWRRSQSSVLIKRVRDVSITSTKEFTLARVYLLATKYPSVNILLHFVGILPNDDYLVNRSHSYHEITTSWKIP